MKTLIAALILLSSISAMAASVPCKIEAHTAAANLFENENPEIAFLLRVKYKPVLEEKIVYHMVEITDMESGRSTQLTVSLNPKTCSVLSID